MDRGLLVLLALVFLASRKPGGGGSAPPPMRINPATGLPIVRPGTRQLSTDQLTQLMTEHGFADVAKAVAIAKRESGGFPDVVVDTRGMNAAQLQSYWGKPALEEYSIGLFQINVLANKQFDPEKLADENENAAAAWQLSRGGTFWGPWGG